MDHICNSRCDPGGLCPTHYLATPDEVEDDPDQDAWY